MQIYLSWALHGVKPYMVATLPSSGICFMHSLPYWSMMHFQFDHAPDAVPSSSSRGSSEVMFAQGTCDETSSAVQFGSSRESVPAIIPAIDKAEFTSIGKRGSDRKTKGSGPSS